MYLFRWKLKGFSIIFIFPIFCFASQKFLRWSKQFFISYPLPIHIETNGLTIILFQVESCNRWKTEMMVLLLFSSMGECEFEHLCRLCVCGYVCMCLCVYGLRNSEGRQAHSSPTRFICLCCKRYAVHELGYHTMSQWIKF